MNIGQLMRAVLGDTAPAEPKTLELKVGQVVKGLVLQLLSEQDAMVNIGGVPLRARLETPLNPGQVTLLQVQPESSGGQIVLKPLGSSEVPIPDDSAGVLLKTIGLPDQADTRQAAQTLHAEGAPVTRETVQGAAAALQARPAGVSETEWKQAVALAAKKGLPLTAETVQSLRQTMFGAPMHKTADGLAQQIRQLLGSGQSVSAGTNTLLRQVADMLGRIGTEAALLTAEEPAVGAGSVNMPVVAAGTSGSSSAATGQASGGGSSGSLSGAATSAAVGPIAAAGGTQAPVTGAGTDRAAATAGGPGAGNSGLITGVVPQEQDADASTAVAGGAAGSTARGDTAAQAASSDRAQVSGTSQMQAALEREDANTDKDASAKSQKTDSRETAVPGRQQAVQSMLKLLGLDHEQKWSRLLQQDSGREDITLRMRAGGAGEDGTVAQSGADPLKPADTLKGLLLQLNQSDDVPQTIKDSAAQVLQQVTGSQLLLTADRAAPFSHITLMLPLMNPETGGQTAAIHIQSRWGQRGGLDAENCRLLFDLQMKRMGATLVDVRVVDKMVNLDVHSDHPALRGLIEGYRDEIVEGMRSAGYQLLSLRSAPFPNKQQTDDGSGDKQTTQTSGAEGSLLASRYKAKPYKGMDVRV